jgi:membrane-bound lytic murein transglycosylase D
MIKRGLGSLLLIILVLLKVNILFAFIDPEVTDESEKNEDSVLWEDLSDPFSSLGQLRDWRQPQFEKSPDFSVPNGLQLQVDFWKRIYSEFSQDQGLLHDTEDVTIVYGVISFADINRRSDINKFRKEYLRKKRLDQEKKKVIDVLKKLSQMRLPPRPDTQEYSIYKILNKNNSNQFYKKASTRVRFQLGQRDKIVQGIYFSGRYLEEFEKIFEEEGLPKELTRLPFVESSFNVMARSRVGASGLWQLMPSVLKKKERVFKSVDLRNYPQYAARIAARVLKNNYSMLKSWPLAVTGYNHGPTGVNNLVKRCGSREIIDLANIKMCKGKRLGFASRNFYPSFLAVLELERNASTYFGKVFWSSHLDGVEVRLPRKTKVSQIKQWFDENHLMFQLFNPHILGEALREKIPVEAGVPIIIPREKLNFVRSSLGSKKNE